MKENNFDNLFNEDKIKKAVRFGMFKAILMMAVIALIIAIIVFVALNSISIKVTEKMSNDNYAYWEDFVKLTVPNGYISSTNDILGFFGGKSTLTISKQVGNRAVKLEDRNVSFSYLPQILQSRGFNRSMGKPAYVGGWSIGQWENGYSRMIFFHPEIAYKEYKNDLGELDNITNEKIIEMGISFDKPYKIDEIQTIFPNINKSWFWIDIDKKDMMDKLKEQAKTYDAKAAYINEYETVGISANFRLNNAETKYTEFLELLNRSKDNRYNRIYKDLESKEYKSASQVPFLGMVVYGTRDDLKKFIGNPHVKASSFGVITSRY